MELGFPVVTVAIVIFVIYLLSSIKILAEYERGVIFRLGRLAGTLRRDRASSWCSHRRPDGARLPAPGSARSAAAGHHHPR